MWNVTRITALITIVCALINYGYAQNNICGPERFRCNNGDCIANELLCDGRAECRDLSDETETECTKPEFLCPNYAFRCKYGACVDGDAVCNGIRDCIDNSDETLPQCANQTQTTTNQVERPTSCRANEFTCDNGLCISTFDICDGTPNCPDSSDETFARCGTFICSPTTFRCDYGACIDGNLRCNGIRNCADGSDEKSQLCDRSWPTPFPSEPTKPTKPTTKPTNPVTPVTTQQLFCKAPPQPQNGRWRLHQSLCNQENCIVQEGANLQLGSRIVYECNSGYKLEGSSDISCTFGGIWLNIPHCIEVRCEALSSASIQATCTYNNEWAGSCESPVLPGTRASLQCRNSYKREQSIRQSDQVTCNTNGRWDPEPIQCFSECGNLPRGNTPLIINGRTPNITEFPWHASMYRDYPGEPKKYFCGATIIQENLLVTAAHCVYDENERRIVNARSIYIMTGNIFRDYDYPLHDLRLVKKRQVTDIYIMCNYLGLIGNYILDIAILKLNEPFILSALLIPACLDPFTYGDQAVLEAGSYGKVAGFGRTAMGESSGVLQSLTVPYVPINQCKSASQNVDTEQYIALDKFCAGYTNGSSVCDGDSGSGLVFKSEGLWFLRGIVSVSLGTIKQGGINRCNNNLYSLYTRISSHIGWIKEVIRIIDQDKTYSAC